MFKPATVVCFWAGLCEIEVLMVVTAKINIFWVVTSCFWCTSTKDSQAMAAFNLSQKSIFWPEGGGRDFLL